MPRSVGIDCNATEHVPHKKEHYRIETSISVHLGKELSGVVPPTTFAMIPPIT